MSDGAIYLAVIWAILQGQPFNHRKIARFLDIPTADVWHVWSRMKSEKMRSGSKILTNTEDGNEFAIELLLNAMVLDGILGREMVWEP